ncbi:sigma-70 family RNA polymerase sigma factor [uncultured Oxalicibacterium sp.]|uniref:sigma-70 family RNA polymerase sigma factor n=1 Tax=uncultured Oxalicibacterium sp. TaxID=1168540 RepID=UPI0025F514FA|nr:sigma-70 family RNA polymerase sigma factor [uncultured Oxalicibacterium sp.]
MATNTATINVQLLYIDHHRWLLGWIRRRMHDTGHASDLMQDTFVKVLVAGSAQEIREPRPFLATIAYRLLVNHWRREELEQAYLDALSHLPEAIHPSPEAMSLLMESLQLIDRALQRLSTKARNAFLMAHLDGMRYADIASELGVTTHSVKKYLSQANLLCFFAIPDFAAIQNA